MFDMFGWTVSELLLYGGIALMVLAVLSVILSTIIFSASGKKLQRKLHEEYGDPASYHDVKRGG